MGFRSPLFILGIAVIPYVAPVYHGELRGQVAVVAKVGGEVSIDPSVSGSLYVIPHLSGDVDSPE